MAQLIVIGVALLPIFLVISGALEELRYWLLVLTLSGVVFLAHRVFNPWLRSRLAASATVTLRIAWQGSAPQPPTGWPRPGDVRFVLSQHRWEPRLESRRLSRGLPVVVPRLRRAVDATVQIQSVWPRPYPNLRVMLPNKVEHELRTLKDLTGQRRLDIRLLSDLALAGLPWEALLGFYAFGEPHLTGWNAIRVMPSAEGPLTAGARPARTGPGPPLARRPPAKRQQSTAVLAGRAWQPLAEASWQSTNWSANAVVATDELRDAAVVHIVAVPVPSTDGPLLQVGRYEFDGSRHGRIAARPVRPERLPVRGAVVLLQGVPLDGTTRSDAERIQAADLRLCAARLMDAGAEIVVVLPSMSSELAATVLAEIAPAMRPSRTALMPGLMRAVEDVRVTITGGKPTDKPDRFELALDVCVFTIEPGEI